MLGKVVLFCAIICEIYAAVALLPLQPKPEKFKDVEGCYIEEMDIMIPFGYSQSAISKCGKYFCKVERDQLIYLSCLALASPTALEDDEQLSFPHCCAQPEGFLFTQ